MKNAKLIAIIVIAVLLGIVVLQNSGSVETKFLFVSVRMPQVFLLLLTAAGGFILGLLVSVYSSSGGKKH